MAALPFNLNYSSHFPPLPKPHSTPKQRHLPKTRNNRRTKHVNENNNDQTCIDDLNDTLLELIFISFQWRQLATFKCVSKRWNSIISNPDFLRLLPLEQSPFTIYLRGLKSGTTTSTCLITEHPHFQKHKLGLDFLSTDDDNYINIVANHKDLLISYCVLNSKESAYYVTNPLTKQFIVVPLTYTQAIDKIPSDILSNFYWPPYLVVGFAGIVEGISTKSKNPNSNHYNNNDGFRIVRLLGAFANVIQIYSSKTGQWTSYLMNNTSFHFDSIKTVTFNDKVYCQGWSKILIIDPFVDDNNIVAPRVLYLPYGILNSESVLGVSRNRLHIAQFEQPDDPKDYPRIKVWELERYNDELTMNNNIPEMAELRLVIDFPLKPYPFERVLPPVFRIFPPVQNWRWHDRVICCRPYDPHIVYFIYDYIFYRCDVVKRRLKVISYHVDDNWNQRFVFLHPFL